MMNLRLSVRSVITLMCCVFGAVSFASAQVHVIQTQDHTIQNPGIGGGDEFGYAVSVDNEQLIVGAPITGLSAFNGFVRLYDFDTQNNVWIESTNQLPDQSNNNIKWGWYGAAVSILGDTVVVGAPKRDPNSTGFFWDGAAFIYRWNGTSWVTIQKAGIQLEQLGTSVSQIANFIAIGAPLHTNTSGDVSGGVYMYERANVGDDWINEPIVDGTATNEEFGYSVALFTDQASDDWLVVGAPGANKAYVYKRGPSDWGTAFVLLPDPLTADDVVAFGNSVTMTETATDTWVIVGDPEFGTDDPQENFQGHVEIYRLSGSTWQHFQTIEAPDKRFNGYFGISLDASGDHVAIGSHHAFSCDPTQTLTTNGAVYVLNYDGNSWAIVEDMNKLISRQGFGGLGRGIAIDGEMVVAGASFSTGGGNVLTYTTLLSASLDCDGENGPDALEWCNGTATDCDNNGVIDACEILNDSSLDCNWDGVTLPRVLDSCELAAGTSLDCNGNGVPDECDLINNPALYDCDGNGVLDACEITDGLHIIFMIDGSGSVNLGDFTTQKNTLNKELCTLATYSNINPLIVTVLQIGDSPGANILGPVWFQHDGFNQICSDILTLTKDGGGTFVLETLQIAETKFVEQGSTFAREIILMGDGNGADWPGAQFQGNVLRSMVPPVRICTASIPTPVQQGGCIAIEYRKLANTTDVGQPINPNQPHGKHVCLVEDVVEDNYSNYTGLCVECLIGWEGTNDCNANGQLDACELCPADIAPNGGDGIVDVSDLLAVVSNWGPCPISCPWDIDCTGSVDIGDLLAVIGTWGCGTQGGTQGVPRTVQDCLNRFPLGSLGLEKCLELVEYLQNQGN